MVMEVESSCTYCHGEGRKKILNLNSGNGMYDHGGYESCSRCGGTGRIRSAYYGPSSNDDEPVARRSIVIDVSNIGFNPGGVLSVLAAGLLLLVAGLAAYYVFDNYLEGVHWEPYAEKAGLILFGGSLVVIALRLFTGLLRAILGSTLWLTIFAGLMALYQHIFNDLSWWSAIWKSAVLFGAMGLVWGSVYSSRIAAVCTVIGGVFLWSWLFNGRFFFW